MSERLFIRDQASINGLKIEEGVDPVHGPTTTFKDVVIASEMIQEYGDGMAYKPAAELKNAYWTWDNRWAISRSHPPEGIITTVDDIHGKTTNLRFVKNLKDHKTGRPNRRGVLADLVVFNRKVSPEVLEDMKGGKRADVSIGFYFTKDGTAGTVEEDGNALDGQSYDYVQRGFMGDHTAFGLEDGRCPMPYCGIGADEVALDPFAGYETFAECVADIMKQNPKYTREQAAATCAMIEKKSKAKHKSDEVRSRDMEALRQAMALVKGVLDEGAVKGKDDLVEEEYQGNATPRTEAERAKAHFNISEEEWEALTEEEKQEYIDKLPPRGSAGMTDTSILDDEGFKEFMSKCMKGGKSVAECAKLYEKEKGKEPEEKEEKGDDYDGLADRLLCEDAVLSYAKKKALPDSAYAYIEPGCEKEDGKTAQRCRHLIIKDPAHVRAALAVLGGARSGKVPPYASKAKPKVCAAAKKFKIESEVCGTKGKSKDLPSTDEVLKEAERVWKDKKRIGG